MTTAIDYEATGPNYAVDKLLDVRERVHQAIAAVSATIVPGMVEEDAVAMARGILVLGEQDMFFLDIEPVYGDAEGDAGQTFVFGDDPEHRKAARDVRALWDDAREQWFAPGLGWELNTIRHPTRPFGAFYEDLLLDDQSFAS